MLTKIKNAYAQLDIFSINTYDDGVYFYFSDGENDIRVLLENKDKLLILILTKLDILEEMKQVKNITPKLLEKYTLTNLQIEGIRI